MKKNLLLTTLLLINLILGMSAVAQINEKFIGKWVFEKAELQESLHDGSEPAERVTFKLENLDQLRQFNPIIEMQFVEDGEQSASNGNYIITQLAGMYTNPVVETSEIYFQFSEQDKPSYVEPIQYGFAFPSVDKLVLISEEVFYTKNGRPIKDILYITLSRLTE
jgi:hypothetical protein